ncbi:MAG TPA: succinate dehydrogenase, cytochrome b556 subunit [Sphingomonadales bacterium]|nr:succinate dehydrogenase, cytochrome b556 subunit [Sphingomonadales bacterium]
MSPAKRPLSPHLQIYRWQLHMALSILHRLTGLFLGLGLVLLAWWAAALAAGPEAYGAFQILAAHPLGRLILFAVSYSLVFHALNGVRHLVWDAGAGFSLSATRRSGQIVAVLSILLTLLLWVFAYFQAGKM